jgi:hypothetical protein
LYDSLAALALAIKRHPHTQSKADAGVRPDEIDKKTLEVRPVDDEIYSDVASVADELPDHAPRFVLLSYPLTLVRCQPV